MLSEASQRSLRSVAGHLRHAKDGKSNCQAILREADGYSQCKAQDGSVHSAVCEIVLV